ncbi:MAG: uracil-DNA glycosylase [Thiovulaceae bacterium]|nr:uracil-DNA glycosylase [Sulfurimonadaceae bacterium]
MKRINCRRCIHYFVTWQAGKPHGCRAYGFKSGQIPSIVVFQSSGSDCIQFVQKKPPKSS